MVFFTSIIIVVILYFLQADGMLYVTVIALMAELINILLTHTLTQSVEKKITAKYNRTIQGYLNKIKAGKKTISELEHLQEEAAGKLYKANSKIKELEQQLETFSEKTPDAASPEPEETPKEPQKTKPEGIKEPTKTIKDHLPDGSKRNPSPAP
ncbi:MAG: hypothetical protein HUK40_10855 [Desulfobacter sp.]|nr:hypothetical protein [Desulfobacter sp.]